MLGFDARLTSKDAATAGPTGAGAGQGHKVKGKAGTTARQRSLYKGEADACINGMKGSSSSSSSSSSRQQQQQQQQSGWPWGQMLGPQHSGTPATAAAGNDSAAAAVAAECWAAAAALHRRTRGSWAVAGVMQPHQQRLLAGAQQQLAAACASYPSSRIRSDDEFRLNAGHFTSTASLITWSSRLQLAPQLVAGLQHLDQQLASPTIAQPAAAAAAGAGRRKLHVLVWMTQVQQLLVQALEMAEEAAEQHNQQHSQQLQAVGPAGAASSTTAAAAARPGWFDWWGRPGRLRQQQAAASSSGTRGSSSSTATPASSSSGTAAAAATAASQQPATAAHQFDWLQLLLSLQQLADRAAAWQNEQQQQQRQQRSSPRPGSCIREPPSYFICPITAAVMKDPVVAADGFTYERGAISRWLQSQGMRRSPMTNKPMELLLVPNHSLRSSIMEWHQQHQPSAAAAAAAAVCLMSAGMLRRGSQKSLGEGMLSRSSHMPAAAAADGSSTSRSHLSQADSQADWTEPSSPGAKGAEHPGSVTFASSLRGLLGGASSRLLGSLMGRGSASSRADAGEEAEALWFTSLDDFKPICHMLHRGRYMTAYFACANKTGQHFLLKKYDKHKMVPVEERGVRRSIAFCELLRHPNLVRCMGQWEEADTIYVVEEYVGKGDIFNDCISHPEKYTERHVATALVKPLLKALAYLHANNIIHRSALPENLYMGIDDVLRLGHLTLAVDQLSDRPKSRTALLDYMAPEMLSVKPHNEHELALGLLDDSSSSSSSSSSSEARDEEADGELSQQLQVSGDGAGGRPEWEHRDYYDEKVDIWQVGCMVHELLCGSMPFEVESKVDSAGLALWADIEQPPGSLPPDCVAFLQQALAKDPRQRPSAEQLGTHPWLARCEAGEPWRDPVELEAARLAAQLATPWGWLRHTSRAAAAAASSWAQGLTAGRSRVTPLLESWEQHRKQQQQQQQQQQGGGGFASGPGSPAAGVPAGQSSAGQRRSLAADGAAAGAGGGRRSSLQLNPVIQQQQQQQPQQQQQQQQRQSLEATGGSGRPASVPPLKLTADVVGALNADWAASHKQSEDEDFVTACLVIATPLSSKAPGSGFVGSGLNPSKVPASFGLVQQQQLPERLVL
ncbi:hypothetical protein COO60DRAFT_1699492 [Scenedesmus sp. NREL 46B-D3]|nr:hypothetical protein COO60DRAFT_1699492 [Scenedesmus sp. NREL 46B-D3]